MGEKKNLIIAPVGDNSYHQNWINGDQKDFDLMLVYFGQTKNKYKDEADYFLQSQGLFKLENIVKAIDEFSDIIGQYEAICLPDDDVMINTDQINNLFRIFHQYDLDLAHPAVSGGIYNEAILKQKPQYILRYTNWLDIMCPVFKGSVLINLLPTFKLNRSGWGINMVWTKKIDYKKVAVIDRVGIFHGTRKWTNQVDKDYYIRLNDKGISAPHELLKIKKDYSLPEEIIEYNKIKDPEINIFLARLKMIKNDFYFLKYRILGEIKNHGFLTLFKNYLYFYTDKLLGILGIILKNGLPKIYQNLKNIKIKDRFSFIYLFPPKSQHLKVKYEVDRENELECRCIINEVWFFKYYNPKDFEINQKDIIIDIGAHIGIFSIYAAKLAKEGIVYSYEPNLNNFYILKDNIKINKVNNLKTFNGGVLGQSKEVRLFEDKWGITAKNSIYGDGKNFISINCVTLKNIFEKNKIKFCDFLKIDCEGAEYEILLNTPREYFDKISKIVIEYHDDLYKNSNSDQLRNFLATMGFEVRKKSLDLKRGYLYAKK